jgi:hypothetical protein
MGTHEGCPYKSAQTTENADAPPGVATAQLRAASVMTAYVAVAVRSHE